MVLRHTCPECRRGSRAGLRAGIQPLESLNEKLSSLKSCRLSNAVAQKSRLRTVCDKY